MSQMEILANFLGQALETSNDETKNQLAQALEDYAEKFPRTYFDSKSRMLREFLDAMEEATDARVSRGN